MTQNANKVTVGPFHSGQFSPLVFIPLWLWDEFFGQLTSAIVPPRQGCINQGEREGDDILADGSTLFQQVRGDYADLIMSYNNWSWAAWAATSKLFYDNFIQWTNFQSSEDTKS